MKKQIEVSAVEDSGTPDYTFSKEVKFLEEATFCDCCEHQIAEGKNVGTEEDYCVKCFENKLIRPYMRLTLGWDEEEVADEMKLITAKYIKLKQ